MKILISIIFLLLCACASQDAPKSSHTEEHDYYVLLSNILKTNENRFTYKDESGVVHSDQLKAFKQLEEIYIRNIETSGDNNAYTEEQAKTIMLFAFYAKIANSAIFNEYLASDLKPVFSRNKKIFLESMLALPFLIPSTCNRLNAFFGFEGKNTLGKDQFVKENTALIEKYLGATQSKTCLNQFKNL